MAVVGSLTLRRVMRHTLPDGRRLPQTEATEYIQADRRRAEFRGVIGYRWTSGRDIYRPTPRTAHIKRCDLQKEFLINFEDREFTAWPIRTFLTRQEVTGRVAVGPPPAQSAPTVCVETETVDTGERREFFGRPARHVITTRRVVPLTELSQESRQTVIDGWYIDLDTGVSCEPWWWSDSGHALLSLHRAGDPPERATFKDIGEPERGYVVLSRTTEFGSVREVEVTGLSTAPLDPALFDVPGDFVCVEQIRQEPVAPLVIRLKQTYQRAVRRTRRVLRPKRTDMN